MAQSVTPDHRNRRGTETRSAIVTALANNPDGLGTEAVGDLAGIGYDGARRQLEIMYSSGDVSRKKDMSTPGRGRWLWLPK
jgi:predicted ArsR family transcriptional regulator